MHRKAPSQRSRLTAFGSESITCGKYRSVELLTGISDIGRRTAARCLPGKLRGGHRPFNPNAGLERPIVEPDTAPGRRITASAGGKAVLRAAQNLRLIHVVHEP